jgi:hypothetical protein
MELKWDVEKIGRFRSPDHLDGLDASERIDRLWGVSFFQPDRVR